MLVCTPLHGVRTSTAWIRVGVKCAFRNSPNILLREKTEPLLEHDSVEASCTNRRLLLALACRELRMDQPNSFPLRRQVQDLCTRALLMRAAGDLGEQEMEETFAACVKAVSEVPGVDAGTVTIHARSLQWFSEASASISASRQ